MTEETKTTPEASVDPVADIASLLAGEDDHQEVEDIEETETDTTLSTDEDDIEADAEDDTEESTQEPEVDESGSDSGEYDVEEVQELATSLGLEKDALTISKDGEISVSVKIDGEVSKQPLPEIIKNFQTNKHITNKSQALAQKEKLFEAHAAEQSTKLNETLEQNYGLSKILEQELMREYKDVDWQELRQYDPAEFAAKQYDFQSRQGKITQLQAQLKQEHNTLVDKQTQEFNVNRDNLIKDQFSKMLASNPTWKDPTSYKKDMGGLREYAQSKGFTADDLANVQDHRLIEVLKDAAAYRRAKGVSTKKLAKVPKLQKTMGVRKKKPKSKLDKLTRRAKASTGGNSREAQVDAIAELLGG